jgi:hypothetical protein
MIDSKIERFREALKGGQLEEVELPEAHFGAVTKQPVDWRNILADEDEKDDDEDVPASEDVVAMLGFDPDEAQ